MIVGFTGTRVGMTSQQKEVVSDIMIACHMHEFHHGDCVGADVEAAELAFAYGLLAERILIHPPIDATLRAFSQCGVVVGAPKTHFARNRDIVDACNMLIATPRNGGIITKETRGGTAYTVNYARKMLKKIMIVTPNGEVLAEWKQQDGKICHF